MIILSQQDPQWASRKLGASSLTVGRFGCTTTCIAMLSDYFGHYIDPGKLASNVNNYTKGGLVIWKNLNSQLKNFKWVWREYGYAKKNLEAALADPNRAVILEVNDKSHWVVLQSRNRITGELYVYDPWDKKKHPVSYYRNVTGASYFERTGVVSEEPVKKNENYQVKSKLIISDAPGKSAVYVFNQKTTTKFPISDWPTFVLLFGEKAEIERVPDSVIEQIPTGSLIPSLA